MDEPTNSHSNNSHSNRSRSNRLRDESRTGPSSSRLGRVSLGRLSAQWLFAIGDFIEALLLGIYALIIGPLGALKGPMYIGKGWNYLRVLLKHQLLSKAIRAGIDWRTGNFAFAISQADLVVAELEKTHRSNKGDAALGRILEDLYTLIARAYMHAGYIDEAMRVIIRAKKVLGTERLTGLADIDAKTAQLVRASLAAGKMIDTNGLVTMFVKSDIGRNSEDSDRESDGSNVRGNQTDSGSEGAGRPQADHPSGRKGHEGWGKILPFPSSSPLS